MPRVSIERFRSLLASGSEHDPAVQAYRALARRPAAALPPPDGWLVWDGGSAAT